MAKGKPRDLRKEQLWRQRLREWHASGLTVRAFCERHGLAEPSFYAWRRLLQQRQAEVAAFVPVHIVPDEAPPPAGAVEVLLPGNRSVRVSAGFDAATLRQVLAVLEDKPC
jgi:transposase